MRPVGESADLAGRIFVGQVEELIGAQAAEFEGAALGYHVHGDLLLRDRAEWAVDLRYEQQSRRDETAAEADRRSLAMRRKGLVIAGAVVIVAVATVLASTLSLSSSGPSSDGPFGPSGPTTETNCFQIPGPVITYGFEFVKNDGSSDATIQRVSYVNPHNLQVLQTFTDPVHNNDLYAGQWGYPPQWMLRQRTSVIRPGHEYEVVIVTRLTGQEGNADAVLVNYAENGTQYVLRTITALEVKHQPLKCSFA